MKYLSKKLTKHVQILYDENYKMLIRNQRKKYLEKHAMLTDWKPQQSNDTNFLTS